MGCNFTFINETKCISTIKIEDTNVWLWKNINRGSIHHLLNVILVIIKINGWDSTDKILIECCCDSYTYQNNSLFDNHLCQLLVDDNNCEWIKCPVCND